MANFDRYTKALGTDLTSEEPCVIQRNRALAFLKNEMYDGALKDTLYQTPGFDNGEKALYRAGQALYGLGRFQDSVEAFTAMYKQYPSSREAELELSRALARVHEETVGEYDFMAMYKEAASTRPPKLDHATYASLIEVRQSSGRGRGVFTNFDVKAGDIVLCEKAFAHAFADPERSSLGATKTSLLMNIHTNRMTLGTQPDLITKVIQKLLKNPSMIEEVTSMYCGSYDKLDTNFVDGQPVIDT